MNKNRLHQTCYNRSEANTCATTLAALLGPGWEGNIWFEESWWYEARSHCRRVTVRPPSVGDHSPSSKHQASMYRALIKLPGGSDWAACAATPQAAVHAAAQLVLQDVAFVTHLTNNLPSTTP